MKGEGPRRDKTSRSSEDKKLSLCHDSVGSQDNKLNNLCIQVGLVTTTRSPPGLEKSEETLGDKGERFEALQVGSGSTED